MVAEKFDAEGHQATRHARDMMREVVSTLRRFAVEEAAEDPDGPRKYRDFDPKFFEMAEHLDRLWTEALDEDDAS